LERGWRFCRQWWASGRFHLKLQFSISKFQIIFNFQITILKLFFFWYLEFEYYLLFVIWVLGFQSDLERG